jgi:hypothetical protein
MGYEQPVSPTDIVTSYLSLETGLGILNGETYDYTYYSYFNSMSALFSFYVFSMGFSSF